jgi:hypothetical protein
MFAVVSQRTVPLAWPLLPLSAAALTAVATAASPLVIGINTAGAAFGFDCMAATMLLEQYQPDWIAQRSQADEIARKI